MGKIAILFSGQGAQAPGMGMKLAQAFESVNELFKEADRLRPGTSEQCFHASKEELSKTINTQPCLFLTDLAAATALKESGVKADLISGFSLGEMAALVFAGVLDFKEGFLAVCRRAELMHKAAELRPGAMAAVLGLSNDRAEEICAACEEVYPVNYNCPGQLVISGREDGIGQAVQMVKQAGGRAIKLPVSGAFHSPFMAAAARDFETYLAGLSIKKPEIPVYANLTAQPYGGEAGAMLARQIMSPVLWEKTLRNMAHDGAEVFIEAGAGRTLCGFVSKTLPQAAVYNVEDAESLENTLAGLSRR